MARLNILSSDDFNKLYKLPSLGDDDRPFVFELDDEDKAYLDSFNDIPKKIDYIRPWGAMEQPTDLRPETSAIWIKPQ